MTEVAVMKQHLIDHGALVSSRKCTEAEHTAPPAIPLEITDVLSDIPRPITPNSRSPVRVVNPNFDGQVLLKLKTTPEDPYYAPYFEGRRRMFELQVQGRILAVSKNEQLYIGMECQKPLELGWWGRFACSIVLRLLHALSFGAHASPFCNDGSEIPHIALPLNTTVDRLIITPPGETPPELCVDMLPEIMTKEMRSAVDHFDPENIYTVSFHSMYLDWSKWQLVNIPGLRPVNLQWFFGQQPVNFVAYSMPKDKCNGPHSPHLKKYVFCLELKTLLESPSICDGEQAYP